MRTGVRDGSTVRRYSRGGTESETMATPSIRAPWRISKRLPDVMSASTRGRRSEAERRPRLRGPIGRSLHRDRSVVAHLAADLSSLAPESARSVAAADGRFRSCRRLRRVGWNDSIPRSPAARVNVAVPRVVSPSSSMISQRFNALNVSHWRPADSADWADEETGERLLNGDERSWRSSSISLPR
jgi:hypothetical protein